MNTKNVNLSAEEFKEILKKEVKRNMIITSKDKKEKIVVADDEKWGQCYMQEHEERELLPKYWFFSDKGNLISVLSGKPYLVRKFEKCKDRFFYNYNIYIDGKKRKKRISCTRLSWLVFGSRSYGKAEKLYYEYGVQAFIECFLNLHHIWKKSNNSPEVLQLLSAIAHRIITRAQRLKCNIGDFLIDFSKMASEEEADKISVLFNGHKVDKKTLEIIDDNEIKLLDTMDSQNNVKFTKQALNKMKSICIIICAIDLLMDKYGIDFFEESKYLFTRDEEYLFYKCEQVENELSITEINQLSELANKDYILCYLNEDNKLECYIENIEILKKDVVK